jgi:predicted DNA-binding transcriptional regulator AlpA
MKREGKRTPDLAERLRQFDALPCSAYVRIGTVSALFGVAPSTVYRWTDEGRLPKPRRYGPNVTSWNVGQLRAVMAAAEA